VPCFHDRTSGGLACFTLTLSRVGGAAPLRLPSGVTVKQVARATRAFADANVMVRVCLKHGLPLVSSALPKPWRDRADREDREDREDRADRAVEKLRFGG